MNIKNKLSTLNISIQKILVLGMIFTFAGGAIAYAQFYRSAGDGFGYGYGYGFSDDYGYGYGYNSSTDADGDYGFFGDDGGVTGMSADAGQTTATISFTSSYIADHSVDYGQSATTENVGDFTVADDIGANTIELSGLTCNTAYVYIVNARDAGDNVWPSEEDSFTTDACSVESGGGGGGGSSRRESLDAVVTPTEGAPDPSDVCTPAPYQHLRTLRVGDIGEDVRALQQTLNQYGFAIATSGPGAVGHETNEFGLLTSQAVMQFQNKFGLDADGVMGIKTATVLAIFTACNEVTTITDETIQPLVTETMALDGSYRRGDRGAGVTTIQKVLNFILRKTLVTDGIFGQLTEQAVREYQTSHGLVSDGIVGLRTIQSFIVSLQ